MNLIAANGLHSRTLGVAARNCCIVVDFLLQGIFVVVEYCMLSDCILGRSFPRQIRCIVELRIAGLSQKGPPSGKLNNNLPCGTYISTDVSKTGPEKIEFEQWEYKKVKMIVKIDPE